MSRSLLDCLPVVPRAGKVHSVYERTANLLCDAPGRDGERGEGGAGEGGTGPLWLSLHPESVPRHPYCIRVDVGEGDGWWGSTPVGGPLFLGVSAGDAVRASRSLVEIGEGRLAISLGDAAPWDDRLGAPGVSGGARARRAASDLRLALDGLARRRGASSLFLDEVMARGGERSPRGPMVGACGPGSLLRLNTMAILDDLGAAWRAGDSNLVDAAVARAVGLGFGVTPSGDDFLTGFVAATRFSVPAGEHACRLAASLDAAIGARLGSTAPASAFMLRAALRRRFSEPLLNLLASLDGGGGAGGGDGGDGWSGEAGGRCVSDVAGLGETSGEDMLAGVLFGLEVSAEAAASAAAEGCYETVAA